jgi:hypothetical protein
VRWTRQALRRATLVCATSLLSGACYGASRRGDTLGVQTLGRWEWHARLRVEPDPHLTIMRLSIDTTAGDDVVLARYEFSSPAGEGDEYALTVGLELGRAHDLAPGTPYPLGPPHARIRAYATVTCLCSPLKPDSVRGTFLLATRGVRQLTGRVDATLYFTQWNDASRHATYQLHQRIDAIK